MLAPLIHEMYILPDAIGICEAFAAFKALTQSCTRLGYTHTAPTVIPVKSTPSYQWLYLRFCFYNLNILME